MKYSKFNPALNASDYSTGEKYAFYHSLNDTAFSTVRPATEAEWKQYKGQFPKEEAHLNGKIRGIQFAQNMGVIIAIKPATGVSGNVIDALCADGFVRAYGSPYSDFAQKNSQTLYAKFTDNTELVLEDANNNAIDMYANGMRVNTSTGEVLTAKSADISIGTLSAMGKKPAVTSKKAKAETGSNIVPDRGSSIVQDMGGGILPEQGSGVVPMVGSDILPD